MKRLWKRWELNWSQVGNFKIEAFYRPALLIARSGFYQ